MKKVEYRALGEGGVVGASSEEKGDEVENHEEGSKDRKQAGEEEVLWSRKTRRESDANW